MNMTIYNTSELYKQMDESKVSVYGAGYVAKRFYKAVCEKGHGKNIDSFVVTNGKRDESGELPIIPISELPVDDRLICVAVHESILEEITDTLKKHGFYRWVWIYPLLYDVMLGDPVSYRVDVPVANIWKATKDNLSMAARYLAMDEYYGKCDFGYQIYMDTLSLYNNPETSKKRLDQFKALLRNWDENGYDDSKPALLLDTYEYIDGAHRIAVASYHNMESIVCNIYASDKRIDEVHGNEVILTAEVALQKGMKPNEVEILVQTNRKISEKYS